MSALAQDDQLSWLNELRRLCVGQLDHLYQVQRYVARGGKDDVRCWCWILPGQGEQAEFTVMKQRVDELTTRDHTESIDINIGDRVGGNSSQHDPQVIQWLVLAFIALLLAGVWYEDYRHGGQQAPPAPQLSPQ